MLLDCNPLDIKFRINIQTIKRIFDTNLSDMLDWASALEHWHRHWRLLFEGWVLDDFGKTQKISLCYLRRRAAVLTVPGVFQPRGRIVTFI